MKLLEPVLVSDGATADDFTDADLTLSVVESATIDDEEALNHNQESHSTDVTSDNVDEEISEEPGPTKIPSQPEVFAALDFFQNCSLFEEKIVAFHLQSYLDKFNVQCNYNQRNNRQR